MFPVRLIGGLLIQPRKRGLALASNWTCFPELHFLGRGNSREAVVRILLVGV